MDLSDIYHPPHHDGNGRYVGCMSMRLRRKRVIILGICGIAIQCITRMTDDHILKKVRIRPWGTFPGRGR